MTIGAAGLQLQAMTLDATREHMTRAATAQVAAAPGQAADHSAVILELSAAAQTLLAPR
jgi:hypothetical protein